MAEKETSPVTELEDISSECREYTKISRENTAEEKKAMKKARKRRKRKKKVKELMAEIDSEKKLKESAVRSRVKYSGMARTYWERWQWELQGRRKLMINERMARKRLQVVKFVLPHIDPSMLEDPLINGERKECYIGRGLFGIVRLHLFRDIKVAVKEFLPHSLREDINNEAHILASLCHPYLPCFLGVCLKETPFRIVMQFHATDGSPRTLFHELRSKNLTSSELVLAFCAQLIEAVHYLHHEVEILHNDITTTNIVVENEHIVLIDFGKATKLLEARLYHLGETEKQEYIAKYPHLAPEVVYGQQRQSMYSDMYSVGLVLHQICDYSSISRLMRTSLQRLAEKCRSHEFSYRPKSTEALNYLQGVLI